MFKKPPPKPRKYTHCVGCNAELVLQQKYLCRACWIDLLDIQAKVRGARSGLNIPPADTFVCVDCGKQAWHYDHRRYSKPLDIEPVCASCNFKRGPALDIKQMIELKRTSPEKYLNTFKRARISPHKVTTERFTEFSHNVQL